VNVAADCIRHAKMNPDKSATPLPLKPWWKSVGFWLGAVVAVFLGWSTVESVYRTTSLYYLGATEALGITNAEASFQIHQVKFVPVAGYLMPPRGWNYERRLSSFGLGLKPEPVGIVGVWALNERRSLGSSELHVLVSVPLWILTALWTSAWFGSWGLRRRRLQKKLAGLAGAVAETDREL
jgi:hypothetical protein